jgi:hypothetical protein
MRYNFHQGSFDFPFPFEDHSTNALLVINPETNEAAQVTIARDRLEAPGPLEDYIKRQQGLITKKIPGYTELSRKPVSVGETGLEAVTMEVRLKQDGYTMSQLQTVIQLPGGVDLLIANVTLPGPLTDAHRAWWASCVSSFKPAE